MSKLIGIDINPAYLDLDEPGMPGEYGGLIESQEFDRYGREFPRDLLLDKSTWPDRIRKREKAKHQMKNYSPYVVNQSPTSTCVYCSASSCLMARYNVQVGLKYAVILAPMSGYCFATRRASSGSTMWGAMEWTTETGLLPANVNGQDRYFKHVLQECKPFIQREDMPSGFRETAKHFKVLEWYAISSREEFGSAILQDMPVCYGRSGHSIMGEDLVIDSRGNVVLRYKDSYGTGRGDDGRLYDSQNKWSTGGAWACASVTRPSDPRFPAGADGTGVPIAA